MIGKRSDQFELFDVGNVFPVVLKPGSFYAQLAAAAPYLFSDDDFAAIYSNKTGRPSVPPSQLALATLLQQAEGVSDEEAVERTGCDLRWAAVLRRQAGSPLCAKSTLQLFRTHLVLHDRVRTVFQASIAEAKRKGLLKGKTLRIAIDTKPIVGRGAVLDTYNLLAQALRETAACLAREARQKLDQWLHAHGFSRYAAVSIKGAADIDWSDEVATKQLLTELVADAERVLALTSRASVVSQASELLRAILLQDIERTGAPEGAEPSADADASGVRIRQGTAKGRIPSATDPEQRHGRKSSSHRFTGHKASVTADISTQLITSVAVLPGDASDATGALELVKQAEENCGMDASETIGDCAYGNATTRAEFAESGHTLFTKVPGDPATGMFPKSAFAIDVENDTVTCPQGHSTSRFVSDRQGGKTFFFGQLCSTCPLRERCTKSLKGRKLRVHPAEAVRAKARAYQRSVAGRAHLRERVVVEHRLARLGQLRIGQARYKGRTKTLFQLMMAATVANLRRVWNWEAGLGPVPHVSLPRCVAGSAMRLLQALHSQASGAWRLPRMRATQRAVRALAAQQNPLYG